MPQSCSLSQDRKIILILNLSQVLTDSSGILLLLHRQFIISQLSDSICFFAIDSS